MGDVYHARPVALDQDRVRDALEKQQRQRALRDELDSQRAAQREARARAGLPASNEPMTRAQRHRQRIAAEQEELRRLESQPGVAPSHFGGAPGTAGFVPPYAQGGAPPAAEALSGTFGRNARSYQAVQQSINTSLPAIGKPSSALPPIGEHSPRYNPPQVAEAPDDESVYMWNRSPQQVPRAVQPPTPPQQPAGTSFPRSQMQAPSREQLAGTLTRAPPPGATQEELARWLNQATEEIRRVRGELGVENPVPDEVATRQRGRGPATRGANVDRDDRSTSKPLVRGASNQRTSSNQRQRNGVPGAGDGKRVAKLEATLAGQMEEMRRMKKQQEEWQSQVDKLNRELKNAREKEKHLTKAVIDKRSGAPKEKRAETAPKPALPAAARGSRRSDKERRPITAGVELDPIDTDAHANRASLPALPDDLRASYENRRALPTPRDTANADAKRMPAQKQRSDVVDGPRNVHEPASPPSGNRGAAPSATISFAQLLKFTESRIVTHKQAQQLWELFSGTSTRRNVQQARQEIGPDEEFGAPMETVETYEDLMPDDDDEDEYK